MALLVKGSRTWEKPVSRTLLVPLSLPDFIFLSELVLNSRTTRLLPLPLKLQKVTGSWV